MKKLSLFCLTLLAALSLSACGSQSSHHSKGASSHSSKVVKHHHNKHSKKKKVNKQSSSSATQSSQASQQTQPQQRNQAQPKSQGEINRERGYDPNGNPLLPGQDHAAGSNPDGSEDAWVRGQDEWIHQHPEINQQSANNQPPQPSQPSNGGTQQ